MIGKVRQRDDRKQDRHDAGAVNEAQGTWWPKVVSLDGKKLSFSLAASALHLVVRQILPPVPQHHTHVSRKQRGSCSFKLIKRFKAGAYIEPLVRLLTGTSGRIALPSLQLVAAKVSKSNSRPKQGNSVDISKAFLENVIWKFE